MGLFGKKSNNSVEFIPDPEQANAWFGRARQMAESHNYESAFMFFASGLKLDPRDIEVHKEIVQVASTYYSRGGNAASSKQVKQVDGSSPVEKFVTALFIWWHSITTAKYAMKAIEMGVAADQKEFGIEMADTVLSLSSRGDKKLSFKELKALMDLFKSTGAWDQAIKVGQAALAEKPGDSVLERELNELSAERAMSKGGYEEMGQEGGFRKFVKDMDKQQELEEEESLAGSAGSDERVLARAKKEFEESPSSPDTIAKYAKILKKDESVDSQKLAAQVLMHGFKETQQYSFRMEAADIKITMGFKKIASMKSEHEVSPSDELKLRIDNAEAELRAFRKNKRDESIFSYG